MISAFEKYCALWHLIQDGNHIITHSSELLPVIYQNQPALLKIARSKEEERGNSLMAWWNGQGAAPVFLHEGPALLMERALGQKSLIQMAKHNQDDEASKIICTVVQKLHGIKKTNQPPSLASLSEYFRALGAAASQHGGLLIPHSAPQLS